MPKENLPRLTESDVRLLASGQSFQRGKDYYHEEAIIEPVRQGMELRAECQGSQYEPYRVNVTLNQNGVAGVFCTCPYDWGGICKHLVALLLTYVHEPESFRVLPPLEELLAQRSKEELVALIGEMVRREPDLMSVMELAMSSGQGQSVDVEAYRRQVRHALRHEDPYSIEKELRTLRDTAGRLGQSGDWVNAGAVYRVLLAEITDAYGDELQMMDEDGDIASLAGDCAQGLGECLAHGQPDAVTRRAWLMTLLEAELTDITLGGIDFAAGARDAILEHATDDEWAWIEQRIRAEIKGHRDWGRQALVNFLSERSQRTGHTEDAAEIVRELGTPEQQAMLLVEEGKIDKAVAIARKHFTDLPGLMIQFADALVKAGARDAAVALITEQTEKKNSYWGYVEWLAKHYQKYGDPRTALTWQRKVFAQSSSVESYKALRAASKKVGVWEQTRAEVLQELEHKKNIGALIEIALHEKDVPRALELLPRLGEGGWGYYGWGYNYKEQVAKAAEKDHPQAAIALYKEMAEKAIEGRQRSSYQSAAQHLKWVKALYERLNAQTDWEDYIQTLRERHARLPALQDELRKARLV